MFAEIIGSTKAEQLFLADTGANVSIMPSLNLRTDIDILGRTEAISNIFNILIRALNMLIEEASHLTQRYVTGEVSIFREAFAFKAIQKSTERHTTCKNYKVLCENVPEVIQDVCNDNECFIVFIFVFAVYNFFLLDSTH